MLRSMFLCVAVKPATTTPRVIVPTDMNLEKDSASEANTAITTAVIAAGKKGPYRSVLRDIAKEIPSDFLKCIPATSVNDSPMIGVDRQQTLPPLPMLK